MARTTPAQKPRGEHSMTSRTGLASGELGVFSLLLMSPDPARTWPGHGPAGSPCQGRPRPQGIAQEGLYCLYNYRIPVIPDDLLRPPGERSAKAIWGNSGDFIGDSAMATQPLMPKATAVWLVENTALSFDQIADFCKLHPLEVKAVADGDSAQGIKGLDPVLTGQLTREEIEQAEAEPHRRLKLADAKVRLPEAKRKKGPRYTPVSRRQDRPNAILWLVRNHPELKDSQIMRLVGTTKSTIAAIRDRTHWNAASLSPLDPVTLGLCSQIDLDIEVRRAAKEKPVEVEAQGATLLPASETTIRREPETEEKKTPADELNVDAVFAKLKQLGGKSE